MIFGRNKKKAQLPSSRWLVSFGEAGGWTSWFPYPIPPGIVHCKPPHWCSQLDIQSTWCRDNFGIHRAATDCWALSSSGRFMLVGDVWLSNRQELLTALPIASDLSDIELLAQLWDKWQLDTPQQLQGMFGLVVCDIELEQISIVRDPVGARTVYYTAGKTWWIAPQLSSLNPYRSDRLDPIALRDYLTCSFVPGERTMWQDVREIRPGTILKLPEEQIVPYWQLQQQVVDLESLEWHGDKLRSQLELVMREYLPTQEPVGVFLSGGLDSSCITALATQLHDAPIHTYSIHFGAECANELEFSSLVANHCQTNHHILEITFQDMWDKLPETMAFLDDPIGDPLTVPNLLVGRLASHDVSITLNGEGGDPCFGGPKNQPMLIDSLYNAGDNYDPLQAYLISFQKCAGDLPQLLKPDIWQQVQQPWIFEADLNSEMSFLNRLMALNIKFKGADQILTKVNNLTQAAGLQGRSPLFDRRIVDLSMTIPPEYKLSGVKEKAVLKQAVADLLPAAIIDRPKSGMMVPVQLGFRKYWQRQARSILLNRNALIAPYIDRDLIKEWLNFRGDVWGRYGVKLWLLVSLEMWLQANYDRQ
ncbi:asparagine synthetase B family protein [Chamaesiphon polymorphus]|uniref:asparagine synthase (glutamine-hydrolyzing) n=1 Tax=Chamaesiphon polymorphus CCALA 037 TaxID=2107692 RepID=A0A2T1GHX6_9CYAN|nr:asparagine synthetase B family protein [Chamaesiphon polymorphus]PSB57334.1 asparagine synthase [Chamaesiphon polymorphus CCALA 037]